jgi:carboxyl-terminal processing protease
VLGPAPIRGARSRGLSRLAACALFGAAPLILGLGSPGLAQEGDSSQAEDRLPQPEILEESWELMRDQFYNREMNGLDWEEVRSRYMPRAQRATNQAEVYEAIVDMLGELGASHAQIVEPDVYQQHYISEARNHLAPMFGLQLVRLEDGYFVSSVLFGSAAEAAGIREGDRVISVGGVPVEGAALWPVPYDAGLGGDHYYRIPTTQEGQEVLLELERFPRPKGLYRARMRSAAWNELEACRASQRVVERGGFRVGYMRLYHLLSDDVPTMLAAFMAQDLQDADAMIVDLRGRGGLPRAVEAVLELFDPNRRGGPMWGRPVVALIDVNTRSAKEILAFEWRQRGIGPLVGTPSAGAVLGARFEGLSDGSFLLFPFVDMRAMTGGVVLERNPLQPDFEATSDLRYIEGRDPIIELGVEVAIDQALARRRSRYAHGWY